MKNVLLTIGLAVSVYFCGVLLHLLTGSGLIANWGSIAIPSFIAGVIFNLFVDGKEKDRFAIWMAVTVLISKMIAILMRAVPDYFTVLLMVVFYFFASYLFIFLGRKITEYSCRGNTTP